MKAYYQSIMNVAGLILFLVIHPLAKINLILPFLMDIPVTFLFNSRLVYDIVTEYKKQGSFAFLKNKSIRRSCIQIFAFLLFFWVITFVIIKVKFS